MEPIGTGATANVCSEAAKGIFHQVKRHIRYVIFYQKIVDKFEQKHWTLIAKRTSVQQDVDVAERNGEKIKADVLDWRHRVEKVVTEKEKKVKDLEVKAKTKCFFGLCPNIKSRYQLSRKAEEAAATFDELIKDCQFERVGYPDVPEPVVHTDFEAFKSREEVFNDIMESLKDATTSMIGVYGMAGVGKTSLVNEVERQLHEVEVKLFDSVVRATVSRIPVIKEIQDQIAYSLGLKLEENSPDVRARKLYGRLRKEKNVLIILDDLWKKLDLEEVGIPFGSQHKGCKILLTSRNQNVLSNGMDATKTFAIVDLDDEEAWEFFKKMARDSFESDEELRSTAIKVAKKCARLPLALATVARALRNKSLFVWRDALQQLQRPYLEKSSSEISAEVHSAIELSINHLSSEDLKQIFLLCSLLRRDTRIEDLLRYACGLGLIKGVNTMKAARDRLLKMMSTLKESCLLLDSKSTNEEYFDVHDLTYIVAKSIASKDNQVLALTEEDNDEDEDEDVVADWLNRESMKECNKILLQHPRINKLPDQLNCPRLFLFLLFSKDLSLTLPDNVFKEAKNLKVLDLTGVHFSSLPSSIGLLTSLSTLCLDHCKLGDNLTIIGVLKNLNVLSVLQSDIKIVPKEIGQLLKLKLLDVSGCTKLEKISADVLPRLSKLEELYMGGTSIQWGQPNASLAELNTLSQLSTLEVQIPDAEAAPEDFFQKFQKLERYKIFIGKEWERFGNYQYSRTLKLRLNTSIDDLDPGIKKLVKRTQDLQLDELKGVKIALKELTDEERLSHMRNLHIQNGLDIESITNDRNEFPELQSLTLQGLPQLVSFCSQDKIDAPSLTQLELPLFGEKISFPSLEKLHLSSLNVTRVWQNQLSNVAFCTHEKLTTLKIEGCGNIKYLLSFSMAKYLVHLKYFEITACNCLREIVLLEEIEEETQATMTLSLFPQLKSLELKDLQHLSGFCSNSQNKVIEFPFMKSMTIYNCPKLDGFICRYTREGNRRISSQGDLFDNKVAFPSLEEMSICYLRKMKMIWRNPLPPNSFPKLQQLRVEGCDKLLTIFPSNTLTTFQRLHRLTVNTCGSLQQVFEIMHEEKETALLATAQLRELHIGGLPKLKYIWKNDPKGIFSFKKICAISVLGCRSLKNVFPASVAKDLRQLGYLAISDCGVEEIVSKLEEGSDSEIVVNFKFDQLYALMLWRLPELKCFYPGKYTAKWPMLNKLEVIECGKMKILGTQLDSPIHPPLFLVEKVIPKLQHLTLDSDYIAMISDSQFSSSLFHGIKAFQVHGHGAKSIDFRISFLERFYTLENLTISYYEMKELFCTEGDTGNEEMYAGTLSTIRNLKLVALNNLKDYLWKQDVQVDHILPKLETLEVHNCYNLINLGSSSASFQNLTTLDVWNCEAMKYLDSCLAVQGMVQLKKLMVRDCISMTEIVATEGDEATCDIIFSRLKSLELVNLPRLKSFCSGNHTFGFPCLEELIVSGCPELEIFCKGVLTNPPLLQKVEYGNDNGHWYSDLNNTIQQMYSIKAGFQAIGYLVLSEFSKSIEIWKENIHGSLDFKKLKVLEVYKCNSMTYIFSVSMALDLAQLEDIKVKQCPIMEQIIKKGAEETEMATLLLPMLKKIRLESCSRLTSFCMGSITLQCPSLYEIAVDDCPKMYALASKREQEDIEVVGREKIPFFNHKVLCANLQYLELSSTNIKILWPDKPDRATSSNVLNLQILIVKGCHNLEYLFPSLLVKKFERLHQLSLLVCKNMEEIIFTDGLAAGEGIPQTYLFTKLQRLELVRLPKLRTFCHQENSETNTLFNQKVAFPSLNDLRIVGMGKCRKIWHDKLTMGSFHELTFLVVEHCDKLSNVLPFDMVERLEKLETLQILECESVEEIIGLADDDGLNSNESIELKSTTKFVFPQIRQLILRKLPKLIGFYSKVHTTDWPLLKLLEVCECSKVDTFAGEYINFRETQGENQPVISVQQPLFWVTKETFPNLEELFLVWNGYMKVWLGHGPDPKQYCPKLRKLYCPKT
ncbi:hypothetical protein ES288_D11G313200v1 [Gossypium darwinii]|uniref:AAA+ ATPase domain-containing protein n=1 Tax=Gossypium darwinii TaxID=34276 RepID=A0A5D2ARV7_GOSDA|nr:hypothetical protein ES288_D11G313200v1 [Gossypium darwinii]TYG47128.1 hypothetical protein ES288_D11G313200v1 [Gossypium darwinii]